VLLHAQVAWYAQIFALSLTVWLLLMSPAATHNDEIFQHLSRDSQDRVRAYLESNPRSGAISWYDPKESLDLAIDILFLVDFVLQFRTAYFRGDMLAETEQILSGNVVDDKELGYGCKKIFMYRLFGHQENLLPRADFIVSFVTSVPWDLMFTSTPQLRLLKCIRVERMGAVMPFVEVLVERGTVLIPALKPITELLITICVAAALCHIMSCFLYFAGHPRWEQLSDGVSTSTFACEDTGTCGWVVTTFTADETSGERYWTAFYYSFTIMATVGFGDISAHNPVERVMTVITMFIGVAMYGVLLGSITSLIQKEDLGMIEYEEKVQQMTQYLRMRGVSNELRYKARDYMEKTYPQRVLFDEKHALGMLPTHLRDSVRLDMYKDQIDAIPFVPDSEQMASDELKTEWRAARLALAVAMVPMAFMKDDRVAFAGQRSNAMHMLVQGAIQVVDVVGEDKMHKHNVDKLMLGMCDCFGELSALKKGREYRADLVACCFTSVLRLDRVALDALRKLYPCLQAECLNYIDVHKHFQVQEVRECA
jgi:hypothetical protein